MTCSFCGALIAGEFYQRIVGWVSSTKRDSLTLRENLTPPEYACRGCIVRRQLGVSEGQRALL